VEETLIWGNVMDLLKLAYTEHFGIIILLCLLAGAGGLIASGFALLGKHKKRVWIGLACAGIGIGGCLYLPTPTYVYRVLVPAQQAAAYAHPPKVRPCARSGVLVPCKDL
jgi:hypothetical protein